MSTPKTVLAVPQVGLIAATRALAGIGIGLLIADRLTSEQRSRFGWGLLALGAVTTVPLLSMVIRQRVTEPSATGESENEAW